MLAFIARRVAWTVFLFLTTTLLAYVVFFVLPANPARIIAGNNAAPNDVARVARYYHFNVSLWQRYWIFLWSLVRHGSLGNSYFNRQPVRDLIAADAPVTGSLVAGSAVLWLAISVPVGVLSAVRPRSVVDRTATGFVLFGISMHPVVLGLVLSYLFGYRLHLTPIAGYCNFFPGDPAATCDGVVQWAYHLILPWITFMVLFAALYVRLIRASLLEAMSEDYVRTARAKGASERRVLTHHALRNCVLPIVTILGMDIGVALGGAMFIETIFQLPGLGREILSAYTRLDLPIVAGLITFLTLTVVAFNFVVDLTYGLLDPRIRTT